MTSADPSPRDPLLRLSLEEVEEAGGELHRRIAMALRLPGERHADRAEPGARSPRWQVARLVATTELAAHTLAAFAAGAVAVAAPRLDQHPATVGSVMYAAATIPALLSLLEYDRRRLASLARSFEEGLDEVRATPWGTTTPRELVVLACIEEPARCALLLERLVGQADV